MQHSRVWAGQSVAGWHLTEKLDGCRGYWDGGAMWSRSGRRIPIPATWSEQLPAMHLDGEIWAGRGMWETSVSAVVHNRWASQVCYMVFDAPEIAGRWPQRLASVAKRLRCSFAAVVPWVTVENIQHVSNLVRAIRLQGGEGVILVHPELDRYRAGRTERLLKLKCCPLTGELKWRERRRFNTAK